MHQKCRCRWLFGYSQFMQSFFGLHQWTARGNTNNNNNKMSDCKYLKKIMCTQRQCNGNRLANARARWAYSYRLHTGVDLTNISNAPLFPVATAASFCAARFDFVEEKKNQTINLIKVQLFLSVWVRCNSIFVFI